MNTRVACDESGLTSTHTHTHTHTHTNNHRERERERDQRERERESSYVNRWAKFGAYTQRGMRHTM